MFDFTPDFEETLSTDQVNIATHGPTYEGSMAHLGQDKLFGLISKDSATLNLFRIHIMSNKRMDDSAAHTRRSRRTQSSKPMNARDSGPRFGT